MNRVNKQSARSSRSRPVSCHFCRSRKLKCSRKFPCSNCTSRDMDCQLYPTPSLSMDAQDQADASSVNASADVLARLRRLEEIVLGRRSASVPLEQPSSETFSLPPISVRTEEHPYVDPQEQSSTATVDWLEGKVTSPGSLNCLLAYEIEFRTCRIRDTVGSTPVLQQNAYMKKCIWLPLHEEAKTIVEKYIAEITHIHHVVHIPSVRTMVDELYNGLRERKPVKLGFVSLLLGILASTMFFWTEHDMHSSMFSTVEEAQGQSTRWMKLTLEVLDYSRYKNCESIEDIQAMIILIFVTTNIAGVVSQARHLATRAISVARELSLHRIDHPHNSSLDAASQSSAKAEIGRRVWWYLVATDWQISQISGPQKGTYTINPCHMMTNKPIHANDEDLVDRPLTQPTSMSYSLQRIRLGELCREITDRASFGTSDPGTPDYKQTKQIDTKICSLAESLPSFFSLTYSSDELPSADPSRSTGIIIQRYIINFLLHAQRCRLHLPYLSRASKDPVYDYSRKACLDAARMIIRIEGQLSLEKIPLVLLRLKIPGMMHCTCVAIIALLINFCMNSSPQQEEKHRHLREIFGAFAILEGAREQSPFAGRLLESFKTVLRWHNVSAPGLEGTATTQSTGQGQSSAPGLTSGSMMSTSRVDLTDANSENVLMDPSLFSLEDLWQAFDDSVDSAMIDWDGLFGD